MKINGVSIDNTFAEAFPMKATRIIITALNLEWALSLRQRSDRFRNLGYSLWL